MSNLITCNILKEIISYVTTKLKMIFLVDSFAGRFKFGNKLNTSIEEFIHVFIAFYSYGHLVFNIPLLKRTVSYYKIFIKLLNQVKNIHEEQIY